MSFDLSNYVDVPARLAAALERWPEFRAQETGYETILLDGKTYVAVTVTCWRTTDDPLPSVARSVEPFPGKTSFTKDSEWENASTSALGRAIGFMLSFGKIAPAEAVRNRTAERQQPEREPAEAHNATAAQIRLLRALKFKGDPTILSKSFASHEIERLKALAVTPEGGPF